MLLTLLRIVNWGWYYLSTILDDYSRKIITWRLCTQMTADEVTKTLDAAIEETGVSPDRFVRMPRLLSDNGPCYISKELKTYLKGRDLPYSRGRPFHPQTQGKIERYHLSMKNIILLDNYYFPHELKLRIAEWVDYYNNYRYHESLGNITPADKYEGREGQIFKERRRIKEKTIRLRRKLNGYTMKPTGKPLAVPAG